MFLEERRMGRVAGGGLSETEMSSTRSQNRTLNLLDEFRTAFESSNFTNFESFIAGNNQPSDTSPSTSSSSSPLPTLTPSPPPNSPSTPNIVQPPAITMSVPNTLMPSRGDRSAPKFDPKQPRELRRYFSDLDTHFARAGITDAAFVMNIYSFPIFLLFVMRLFMR